MSISQLDKLAAEIGIKAETTPPQARAQILKQLASSGFTPPDSWRCVATKYAGTSPKRIVSEQAQKNMDEKEVGAAIDSFATQYFFLNPEKRRQRWEDLSERAKPFARCRMRIGMLEQGLDLHIPEEYTNDKQEAVIEYVRQLYPLRHSERIKARPEVLKSLPLRADELEKVVADPPQRLAKWVNLEEGLFFFPFDEEIDGYRFEDAEANFDQYEPEPNPEPVRRPKKKRPVVRERHSYDEERRRAPQRDTGNNTTVAGVLGGVGVVVLILICAGVRIGLREASRPSSTSTNYSSPSPYTPPNTNFNPPVNNPPVTNPPIVMNPPVGGPPPGGLGVLGMGAMGSTISGFGNMGGGINPQPMIPTIPNMGAIGMGFPSFPNTGGLANMGFPSFPNTGGPSFPNTGGPSFPNTGGPSFPNTGGPSFPNTGGPKFPNTGGPSMPGTGIPKTGSISGFPSGSNTGIPRPGTGIRGN